MALHAPQSCAIHCAVFYAPAPSASVAINWQCLSHFTYGGLQEQCAWSASRADTFCGALWFAADVYHHIIVTQG